VEASRAVEEVRRVIDDLRPTALDSAPLAEAVRSAADRVAPAVSVEVDGDLCAVSPDVASTAYRIAAEALTNVAKHSGASSCFVELRVNDDQLTVCVRDDGQGMSDAMRTGVGIDSMRRRAAALGGSVAIGPVDPSGTQVLAMLPLRAAIA
jgi:signal transduction histidine kinase